VSVKIIMGDCREVLATLPAESVQCCVTSPPYFGLRDYGTATWEGGDPECSHGPRLHRVDDKETGTGRLRDKPGHSCKCGAIRIDSQIGLEPSPQEYVDQLVAVFREVHRVLRKDGTAWLNLGDSYAGSWGNQGRKEERGSQRPINGGQITQCRDGRYPDKQSNTGKCPPGLKPKDLLLIPARVALALQQDGWWVRSEIIWSKAAPMPESVRDRPTCAHEKVWLLTRSERYFYDADAVAEPLADASFDRAKYARVGHAKDVYGDGFTNLRNPTTDEASRAREISIGTRNLRNVWHLNPEPFRGAHFATMPPTLAERCIKAGTSEKGCCRTCGAPWVRETIAGAVTAVGDKGARYHEARMDDSYKPGTADDGMTARARITTGWAPSCACPDHAPVPCTVLDPFAGPGTTLLVADRLQRHAIGIELSQEYVEIARRRVAGDAPLFAEVA
jgi:DNA modification methylase